MTTLHVITEWLLANFWIILIGGMLFWWRKILYEKFIFTPLAGGNGKIQMDELTKGVIVAIAIWCVRRDGYRTHEWAYFSDSFYFVLFGAVCAIAAIKPTLGAVSSVLNAKVKKNQDPQQTESNGDDKNQNQHQEGNIPPIGF